MLKMARSESCQGGRGSRGRTPSLSPETQRKSVSKRKREISVDMKLSGGGGLMDLSRVTKKEQKGSSRERSRSKSPRRNSWREEIKDIRSWREDGVERVVRVETSRDQYRLGKSEQESKKTSRGSVKHNKKVKKCLDLLERKSCFKARIAAEASARVGKKRKEDLKKNSRSLISRKEKHPCNYKRRGILKVCEKIKRSTSLEHGKASGVMNQVREELVIREVENTDVKETLTQADQEVFVKELVECEELELGINDEDVFPELREEHDEQIVIVANGNNSENKEPSKSKIDQGENLAGFCQISFKSNVEEEEQIEIEKSETELPPLSSSGCLIPQVDLGSGTAASGDASNNSSSSQGDSSAMARNFSLLELRMEVFTTRLKELEWEREQLRNERAGVEGYRNSSKRYLLKGLQEKKT